jgi:hypothetical protein
MVTRFSDSPHYTSGHFGGEEYHCPQWEHDHDSLGPVVFVTLFHQKGTTLMQPHSNRETDPQKYYDLLQIPQGGHPLSCSTIHYGQVEKRHWTQVPDKRETGGWSTTLGRDRTCRPSQWGYRYYGITTVRNRTRNMYVGHLVPCRRS